MTLPAAVQAQPTSNTNNGTITITSYTGSGGAVTIRSYLLYHRPGTPPLHYSILREIPCNLARRFPLYGVEADGLPLRVARREKENRMTEP